MNGSGLLALHKQRQGKRQDRKTGELAQGPEAVNTHLPGHVCEVGPTGLAAWFRACWGRKGAVPRIGIGLRPGSLGW